MKVGWGLSLVVGAKLVDRAYLLKHKLATDDVIDARLALMKDDINSGRLKPLGQDGVSKFARELIDPDQDLFVVIFDGQHRSEWPTGCVGRLLSRLSLSHPWPLLSALSYLHADGERPWIWRRRRVQQPRRARTPLG